MAAAGDDAAVENALKELEGMEVDVEQFVEAMLTNPMLIRKVAIATGFSTAEIQQLAAADLASLFHSLDKDTSGTLSFDEFVAGLVQIRQQRMAQKMEEELAEEQAAINEAYMEAAEAFDDASFGQSGELDMGAFMTALQDIDLMEKVARATQLPQSFFESLNVGRMMDLFQQIDVDSSGTISFSEWVDGLVRIRREIFVQDKIEEEEARNAVLQHAEEAMDEGDENWDGEFEFDEFLLAFRQNPRFLRKVSLATGVPVPEYQQLADEDLADLFNSLDTDFSGTVSFDEFVAGLVEIRRSRIAQQREEDAMEEEAVLDDAYMDAADAFENADFAYSGELDLNAFMEALQDPLVVDKVAIATKLPMDFFDTLDHERMIQLFTEIDTDSSGTVSFNEWVNYLVDIRKATFEQQKFEETQEREEVARLAEAALEEGDEDWSGEFDFAEFLRAFRTNPRFLRKVALATEVPVEEYRSLCDEDLEDLFNSLDTDFSGTISFDEFVVGLLDIRKGRQEMKAREEALLEEQALDEAYMEAVESFEDADFGMDEEVDLTGFAAALQRPELVEKVSNATKLPLEFFQSLDAARMKQLFEEIDADHSGTVSFQEWVSCLVRIRQHTYKQQRLAEEAARRAISSTAADAMDVADQDWSGEFNLQQFLEAFHGNRHFLQKVAAATGVAVDEFMQLRDQDLHDLFAALDTDYSGTVDFDEFVEGLVKIRLAREEEIESSGEPESTGPQKKRKKKKKKQEQEGPPPYVQPKEVERLPPLNAEQKAGLEAAFEKLNEPGWGIDSALGMVTKFLEDLYLIVDEHATRKYLDKAFPGRDLSWGLKLDECEALYRVALDAQPLSTAMVRRSLSAASLPAVRAKDLRNQEADLRKVFELKAGKSGNMPSADVGEFLRTTGFTDTAAYSPSFLDEFHESTKSGTVTFPDVLDLCNTVMTHALKNSKSLMLPAISEMVSKQEKIYRATTPLGNDAAGPPALSLRRRRREQLSKSSSRPTSAMSRSSSAGRLSRF